MKGWEEYTPGDRESNRLLVREHATCVTTGMEKDTLYYDGACPLCRAEIGKLKRHTSDKLCLVDIHRMDEEASVPDREALLARLHLRTADGEWLTGLDANIRAWHHTPFRRLWRVLGWPLIRPFAAFGYETWLKLRARRD